MLNKHWYYGLLLVILCLSGSCFRSNRGGANSEGLPTNTQQLPSSENIHKIEYYKRSGFVPPDNSYQQKATLKIVNSKLSLDFVQFQGSENQSCEESIELDEKLSNDFNLLSEEQPITYKKHKSEPLMADCPMSGLIIHVNNKSLTFPTKGARCLEHYYQSDSIDAYVKFFDEKVLNHLHKCEPLK